MRSLVRLQQFELACRETEVSIAVRRTLPPVHRRHVRRLPAALQARHNEWTTDQATKPIDLARRRSRRFALILRAQGEQFDAIERALHTGGFHPALASEAVRWARAQEQEQGADHAPTQHGAELPPDQQSLPAVVPRR